MQCLLSFSKLWTSLFKSVSARFVLVTWGALRGQRAGFQNVCQDMVQIRVGVHRFISGCWWRIASWPLAWEDLLIFVAMFVSVLLRRFDWPCEFFSDRIWRADPNSSEHWFCLLPYCICKVTCSYIPASLLWSSLQCALPPHSLFCLCQSLVISAAPPFWERLQDRALHGVWTISLFNSRGVCIFSLCLAFWQCIDNFFARYLQTWQSSPISPYLSFA